MGVLARLYIATKACNKRARHLKPLSCEPRLSRIQLVRTLPSMEKSALPQNSVAFYLLRYFRRGAYSILRVELAARVIPNCVTSDIMPKKILRGF